MTRNTVLRVLLLLAVTGCCAFADGDFECLPSIPGSANGRRRNYPSSLYADRKGHLYVQVQQAVLVLALTETEPLWRKMELDTPVMHLTRNAQGEVFASCYTQTNVSFRLLNGTNALEVARLDNVDCQSISSWYVDGVGRAWVQQGREKLVIAAEKKEPQIITSEKSRSSFRVRRPCEWKPGHLVLFYKTSMVRADPDKVTVEKPPAFAADGTGKGPFLMGKDKLVSGGGNNEGAGSYMMDLSNPAGTARRIRLGWDWFYAVGSAPSGQVLVLAQTDRNPQYTFFWYASDGGSQVQVQHADRILRKDRLAKWHLASTKPVFNTKSTMFICLQDRTLGIVGADVARAVQAFSGEDRRGLADIALFGDDLIMMATDGSLVLWHTTGRKGVVRQTAAAPVVVEDVNSADYRLAFKQWVSFAQSKGKNMAPVVELQKMPEAAVTVLIDLLYGQDVAVDANEEIDRLIQRLGGGTFKVREAAEKELVAMGYGAVAALRKHVDGDDPELKSRAKKILAAFPDTSVVTGIREDLKNCALSSLGSSLTVSRTALKERLRNALVAVKKPELKTEIGVLLWLLFRDREGYKQCVAGLRHEDNAVFNVTLESLTAYKYAYRFDELIGALKPVLARTDKMRRKLVIARLSCGLGEKSVRKAAEVIAPFLVSEDDEERKTAAMALAKLQASGWCEVLKQLAEEHEDETIRQAAGELIKEGMKEK